MENLSSKIEKFFQVIIYANLVYDNLSILSINATNQNIKQRKVLLLKEEEELMWKHWAEGQQKDRTTAKAHNLQHTVIKYLGDEEMA